MANITINNGVIFTALSHFIYFQTQFLIENISRLEIMDKEL